MIRHYDDENDTRLKTIEWVKAHLNELNDSDKVLLLANEYETMPMKIFNACPSEALLDEEDEKELSAAKIAL